MKKGLALQTTVMIILITASFIILLPAIYQAVIYGENYAKGGACQASAAMASFRVDSKKTACIDVVESPTSMRCERRHVIVNEHEALVIKGGKEKILPVYSSSQNRSFKKYDNLDSAVAQSVLAEEMRLCWKQFGEGSKPLLDHADVSRFKGAFVNYQTACFICSDIIFSDSSQFTSSDFGDYIRKNTMPGGKETYISFFNSGKTLCEKNRQANGTCWSNLEKYFTSDQDKERKFWKGPRIGSLAHILAPENYAVVYVRKGFDWCQKTTQKRVTAEMSNFVYALPIKDIPQLCDAVVT